MAAFLVGYCIGTDMKLAVETFAQNQQRQAMYMEIVAATGTAAYCSQKGDNDQNNNPYSEQRPHCSVGGRNLIGNP